MTRPRCGLSQVQCCGRT